MSKSKLQAAPVSDPAIIVVWDPRLLSKEQYAELIELIGNVVRSHGGAGINLLSQSSFGVAVEEGVPV